MNIDREQTTRLGEQALDARTNAAKDKMTDRPLWTWDISEAVILRNGVPITHSDLLSTLNRYEGYIDSLEMRINQARTALGEALTSMDVNRAWIGSRGKNAHE